MAETITVQIPCGGCFRLPKYEVVISSPFPAHLLIVDQQPAPGTLLQAGAHQITITITDPAGNVTVCEKILHVECTTTYYNTEQVVTCGDGEVITIAAGLYSSTVSQEEANALAIAAAEDQCCPDTSSFVSGGLNNAVYDESRNIIFATGNAGHVIALDGDTGAVLYESFIFLPDFGEGYIAYVPSTDRIYIANWMDFGTGTTDFLYELNPDDFSITNSKQASLLDANVSGTAGFRRLYHFNGFLYAEFYRPGFRVYRITPSTLTLVGSPTFRSMNSTGTFGDLDFNSELDPDENHVWLNDSNTVRADRYSSDLSKVYHSTASAASGRTVYGLAWCPWNQSVYWVSASQFITKAPKQGCPVSEINLGISTATPYNIRYRASNKYLYIPNFTHGSVSILSPDTDVIVTVTGFTAPFDVVFTADKAWAVCHGRVGLQEIVADLPVIGDPAPARTFTQTSPPVLKAYYTFETDVPGHWPDSKGTNHLVATPGNARTSSVGQASVLAIAVQADGDVVIGGAFVNVNGTTQNRISRIKGSGYVGLDSTFATNIGTGFNTGSVLAIAIQGDGKILVGGTFTSFNGTSRVGICRLNTDGTLDAGFDPGTGAATVRSIGIQSSGKIIIVGDFTSVNGNSANRIARLNTDGSFDATFTSGTGVNTGQVRCVAIHTDVGNLDKIVIGGNLFTSYDGNSRTRIARINSDGTIDAGFQNGLAGANSNVNTAAIQTDGNIIIGGAFTTVNGTSQTRLARLSGSDGSLDATLSGAAATTEVLSIVLQSDGKILVGSAVASATPAMRLNSDGSTDSSYSLESGTALFNRIGISFSLNTVGGINAVAVQSDGKVLWGGGYSSGVLRSIVRSSSAGLYDIDFNPSPGANSIANIQGNGANFNLDEGIGASSFYGLRSQSITNFTPDVRKGITLCFWLKWTVTGAISSVPFSAFPPRDVSTCPIPSLDITMGTFSAFYDDGFLTGESVGFTEVLNTQYFIRIWVDPADRKIRLQVNMGTIIVGTRAFDQIHEVYEAIGSWIYLYRKERSIIIDEMALYEGVLSDSEASYLYNGGVGRTYPDVPYP